MAVALGVAVALGGKQALPAYSQLYCPGNGYFGPGTPRQSKSVDSQILFWANLLPLSVKNLRIDYYSIPKI